MATISLVDPSVNRTACAAACFAHGHCCTDSSTGLLASECSRPSCVMGRAIASHAASAAECLDTCAALESAQSCTFDFGGEHFAMCESCPDCGASECAGEEAGACSLGCKLSFVMPLSEPWPALHDFDPAGAPAVDESPDPLVRYTWSGGVNASELQFTVETRAADVLAEPPSAFRGLETLTDEHASANVSIVGAGWIRLDFGVERPAWLELNTSGLDGSLAASSLLGAVSEYDEPFLGKTQPLVEYAGGVYRLEPNPQLYEGVRFAWICFGVPCPPVSPESASKATAVTPTEAGVAFSPWRIRGLRLVAQAKPLGYTGSYASSDRELVRVWYTGAYSVRATMLADNFGSILMERGDRVAFQGDGHPTMAVAEAAFGSPSLFALVRRALNLTDSGCTGCGGQIPLAVGTYPIYWTLSVFDYYTASADLATFLHFAPDVAAVLDGQAQQYNSTDCDIGFVGWDDRVGNGNGLKAGNSLEARRCWRGLLLQATLAFSAAWAAAKQPAQADKYARTAEWMRAALRAPPPPPAAIATGNAAAASDAAAASAAAAASDAAASGSSGGTDAAPWYAAFGLHASAHAINAGAVDASELPAVLAASFNDSTTICSFSPFNTAFILEALGRAGERAPSPTELSVISHDLPCPPVSSRVLL